MPQDGPVVAQPDLVNLSLARRLKERDLKVGSDEDSNSDPKKVKHLDVDDAYEFIVCKALGVRLDAVCDKIVNRRRRSDDEGTIQSSCCRVARLKSHVLCDGEVVGERREREGAVYRSIGEVVGQLLRDFSIYESVCEITKHEHEEGKGHTVTDGQERAEQHQ